MADLAALRRTHAAGLTGGVRREVVVVHVALAGLRDERVELLLHAEHVQRGDAQDLGLAALEQRRAVHARDGRRPRRRACGCRRGPRPSMRTFSLMTRSRTSFLVSERYAAEISFSRPSNSRDRELLGGQRLDAVQLGLALLLAGDGQRGGELARRRLGDAPPARRPGSRGRPGTRRPAWRPWRRARPGPSHEDLDERLGGLQTGGDDLLGRRLRRRP